MGELDERADAVRVRKTITEADVLLFAAVTGDQAAIHLDDVHARGTPYGERVAHGALVLGLMSGAATRYVERHGIDAVSYGYDRLRFTAPVRIGDTVEVVYARVRERERDGGARQLVARAEARNQRGELVAVAEHLLHLWPAQEAA